VVLLPLSWRQRLDNSEKQEGRDYSRRGRKGPSALNGGKERWHSSLPPKTHRNNKDTRLKKREWTGGSPSWGEGKGEDLATVL